VTRRAVVTGGAGFIGSRLCEVLVRAGWSVASLDDCSTGSPANLERGRSLGVILIGAQQTASEVERRVIANSSLRVVGRLDSAEAGRPEYAFLPPAHRQRATISKPGTMILSQPELPVPLVLEFPFPAWATRPDEAEDADGAGDVNGRGADGSGSSVADPFAGLGE